MTPEQELYQAVIERAPIGEVKDHFPGAQITKITEPTKPPVDYAAGGDPIPPLFPEATT